MLFLYHVQRKEDTVLYFWIATVSLTVGIIGGAIISNIHHHRKSAIGALKVNSDDPDGPYLFLEISNEKLHTIARKNQVILDVKIVSQK